MIYTFDTRDLITWALLKDHFKLEPKRIFHEINIQFEMMIKRLESINVPYGELKNVLVPQKNKREICLVFDSMQIQSSAYGRVILNEIMPVILTFGKVAVFYGDLLGKQNREWQLQFKLLLEREIIGITNFSYKNSNQFFLVFLNNITEQRLQLIISNINKLKYYIGYFDLTYRSLLKDIVSCSISQRFFIYKNIAIMASAEDDDEDVNYCLYDFKKSNYIVRNVDQNQYGSFLCFKIYRRFYEFDREDFHFSLNALTEYPTFIDDYEIIIDEPKFNYLLQNKNGSLSITGIDSLNIHDFKSVLASHINRNYIFNIEFKHDYKCIKFNTILDFYNSESMHKEKYVIAFEYLQEKKQLRLITMY